MFFALRPLPSVRLLYAVSPWRLDTSKGVQGRGL
jgi:hypothetical protein